MSSTHFGIQRQDFCATCSTIVALYRSSVISTKSRPWSSSVWPAPYADRIESPREASGRGGNGLDPAPRGKGDLFVDRRFRHKVERIRNGASGGGRKRLRVALVLEPSRRKTDKVDG